MVGGVADHVHIMFDMAKAHAPAEFVERSKRDSPKFVKTLGPQYKDFYWQRGSACFPPAQRIKATSKSTFAIKKSITGQRRFKKNTAIPKALRNRF